MLHFFSFIWFCLLLAAVCGALLWHWWQGRKQQPSADHETLQKDLETAKRSVLERDKQLEALRVENTKQVEALKSEVTSVKTERDRVRAEAIPLNARIDELTRSLADAEKAAVAKAKTTATGPKTLGELEAIGAERDQLKAALTKAQEQLQAHTQALTQANTNIQTANATIQTAQAQLQAQEARLQEQSAELSHLRTSGTAPEATSVVSVTGAATAASLAGLTIPAVERGRDDDLKEIVGVGPFIESKLHALGIRTFKQIALLSPEMLEKVAENIEFFQGRIGRENWTEQCKALHFEKYGEKL